MRVTSKGQVTIPLGIRKALHITPGTDVQFKLDNLGAHLLVSDNKVEPAIKQMRGAGDIEMTTDEILALTRQ